MIYKMPEAQEMTNPAASVLESKQPTITFDLPKEALRVLQVGDKITIKVTGKVKSIHLTEDNPSDWAQSGLTLSVDEIDVPTKRNQIQEMMSDIDKMTESQRYA